MLSVLSLSLFAALYLHGASANPAASPMLEKRALSPEYYSPFPVEKRDCRPFLKAGTIESGLDIEVRTFYHTTCDGSHSSIVLQDSNGGDGIIIKFRDINSPIDFSGTVLSKSISTPYTIGEAVLPANNINDATEHLLRVRIKYRSGTYYFTFFTSNKWLSDQGEPKKREFKVAQSVDAQKGGLTTTGICYKINYLDLFTHHGQGTFGCEFQVTPLGLKVLK
ncbi:hypothetical protein Dda_4947 [Drechslerella dactyloides]|uniref:Uncharacterized protein n=1 Tax=Drechslerella dactyloides TaxID=74499 RepID=A0AAD6IXU5_DREDA|nr:hypothetical protein Dda_4947 [Drechslerella dactyloides]